jgi:hypothetical protein
VAAVCLVACGGAKTTGGTDSGVADAVAPSDGATVTDSSVVDASTDVEVQRDAPEEMPPVDAAADGPSEAGAPTITFSGTIVSSGPSTIPLSSGQVCVAQTTNCSTTDSQGAFSLLVPANAQVAITIQRTGYTNVLVPILTNDQDQAGWEIGTLAEAQTSANYAAIGATYPDSSTAFLAAYAEASNGSGHPGVSFQFAPAPSAGPLYPGAADQLDAGGTSTSTWGEGFATFPASVTAVTITFPPATLSCTSVFGGWGVPAANAVNVPLLAGFETHVGQACLP